MSKRKGKQQPYMVILLLAASTCAVYWRILTHDFISVYDDRSYILTNTIVQRGLSLDNIIWAFKSTDVYNWHPLTWITHMMDCHLYGPNAGGHHATSLILHVASVIVLFIALRRMTGSTYRSAFVAALFGVHPAHVESVAWIAERKDVLSGFFWMLTMWTYAFYAERPSVKRYLLVVAALACGLMSKPMLVSLPLILLLLDFWPLKRLQPSDPKAKRKRDSGKTASELVIEKVPFLLMSLGSSIATFVAQRSGGAVQSVSDFTPGVRVANALVSYVAYIQKTVWPDRLPVLYPHPGTSLPTWEVIGASAFLVLVTAAVIRFRDRYPCLPVGWLWYVITLIPVIGLIQVGKQAMANRYTYLPIVGLFIMAAWGVPELLRRSAEPEDDRKKEPGPPPPLPHARVLAVVACLIVAGMAVVASFQVTHWKNSITLFEYTVKVTKNNPFAQGNLGWAYLEVQRGKDAIAPFKEAVRLRPEMNEIHYGIGSAYLSLGEADNAIDEFRTALKNDPEFAPARQGLALAIRKKAERMAGGVSPEVYRQSVRHYNNAIEADQSGDADLAMREYKEAIRLRPNFAEAHLNLAVVYYKRGEFALAWQEVHKTQEYGYSPDPGFVQALSQRMPEPE